MVEWPPKTKSSVRSWRPSSLRTWSGVLAAVVLVAPLLLITHEIWSQHGGCAKADQALVEVCPVCELSQTIPGGAGFFTAPQGITATVSDRLSIPTALSPESRLAEDPAEPRAPPVRSA